MDCCNYVEAYAAGGHHFYHQHQQQQQQPPPPPSYFCYENGSAAYGANYDAAPISNAIEINARYNGAIPPAYPPDYVYNPKEARLRKAMREQSREQSRERSRRSILQNAIAIANARGAPIAAVSASVAGGFLNQHHRFDCVSATPSVPMPGPGISAHRTEPPWYQQAAHRPKPVHSPRIGDWYGGMDSDPIERLQAMGAMHHQQQQQQQRGLDKPPPVVKEQRNQECAATAFSSNGHSPDFAAAERELRRQETAADYADFVDGQKWHPYQNSVGSHPHPRTSHPSPQMSGILHPNANAHGHAHGPWGQFCHGVLPHVPTVTHSAAAIRGPRHAVFLRDRPPTRHCAFPEDASRMGYAPSKLDVDGIRASYPSPEHQMPRLLESAMDSVVDSTAAMSRRDEDDGTRWGGANNVAADVSSLDEFVPTSMPQEGAVAREKERESWRSNERFESKKKPVSRQPLPGFHQAFGSTEIGKFSRSEFFVNMVGENGGGGGGNGDGGGNVGDADDGDVSRERPPLLEAAAAAAAATAAAAAAAAAAAVAATTNAGRTFDAADQAFAVGDGASYRGQPTTTPSWHSPHVGAIGSEI